MFLDYYRGLGVDHFLFVDNDSDDGSRELPCRAARRVAVDDQGRLQAARFGMDWISWLLWRHGAGHWCLTVDPDELFVYPHCDTRPLRALTDWLDGSANKSFPAMLLDMYPRGCVTERPIGRWQTRWTSPRGSTRRTT